MSKLSVYGEFTYEGVGLSISNGITKTYNTVKAVSDIDLKPVTVNVAPIEYKDIKIHGGPQNKQRVKGHDADNAFYAPEVKEITFLPQSEEYQREVETTPFREVAMVASHEYGHHIFQTAILDHVNLESEFKHADACFQSCRSNERRLC